MSSFVCIYALRYVQDRCGQLLLCRLAASDDTLVHGHVFVAKHKKQILPVFLIHYHIV